MSDEGSLPSTLLVGHAHEKCFSEDWTDTSNILIVLYLFYCYIILTIGKHLIYFKKTEQVPIM